MKRDDLIVFYSPKTQRQNGEALQFFTAIGKIIDDAPFQVELSTAFKPFRRKLTFFDCKKWGSPFRSGLFQIDGADFKLISEAMQASIPQ